MRHAHLARDPQARERLRREVIAARRVSGDGVVGVHELVIDGDRVFLVQDLEPGGDLAEKLASEGAQPEARAIAWCTDIAGALARAHAAGVLHRDVKPANILIDREGRARLGDFGLARVEEVARATATSQLAGSLGYTAPEVLAGILDDPRSDQYGLAVTMYELIVGERPFGAGNPAQEMRNQLDKDPPRADAAGKASKPVADVLARAMARRPEARFPTVAAFSAALTAAAGGSAPEAAPELEACGACGEPVVHGLPACPHCGKLRVLAPRSANGQHLVRVYAPVWRFRFGRQNNFDRLTFDEKKRIVDIATAATGASLRPADAVDAALARPVITAADHLDERSADLVAAKLRDQGLNADVVGPGRSGNAAREWWNALFPLFPAGMMLSTMSVGVVAALLAPGAQPVPLALPLFMLWPLFIATLVTGMMRWLTKRREILAGTGEGGVAQAELEFPAEIRDAVPAIVDSTARDLLAEVLRAAADLREAGRDRPDALRIDVDEAALTAARGAVELARRLSALEQGRPAPNRLRLRDDPAIVAAIEAAESERAQAVVEIRHRLLDLAAGMRSAATGLHRGAADDADHTAIHALATLKAAAIASRSTAGEVGRLPREAPSVADPARRAGVAQSSRDPAAP